MSDSATEHPAAIDREAVVSRHHPVVRRVEPRWPLQVGNGTFAVGVDITGLQTYPGAYPHHYGEAVGTLLGTMSSWGWHSVPAPRPYALAETERSYETPRGPRPYVDMSTALRRDGSSHGSDAEEWLRNNPHRLQLARIGFVTTTAVEDLSEVEQTLDLWNGTLASRFRAPGHERVAQVRTAVHPERDALAVTSTSGWPVALAFPYGSQDWAIAEDWERPQAHRTALVALEDGRHRVDRTLDGTRYWVWLTTTGRVRPSGEHEVVVEPVGDDPLELVIEIAPEGQDHAPLTADDVLERCRQQWPRFWRSGAALDLGAVDDPRAREIERRVVLSQYLTRVNTTAPMPPSETGLLTNSWRGKAHLEMHWWHSAHLALWGRPELLEDALDWYATIAPEAFATARHQGYRGARWPKQVGPEGRESPSNIGTFLLWQQPHPLHLAELVVRAHRAAGRHEDAVRAQRRWLGTVRATADFMADVAEPLPSGGYGLGPPLVPAQESYGSIRDRATNPAFELGYWRWALLVASRWCADLGEETPAAWQQVADGLVVPHVRDGVLTAIDVDPWTIRTDHPSMLAVHGVVPPVGMVDDAVVRATLHDVLGDWDWSSTWGWDYPVLAMTAARLQDPERAVDCLLMPLPKNEHGVNGHNRQDERLPAYLPGNGGLLAAVALMAAGWDGGPDTPGLPGSWDVRHEGFVRSPGPLDRSAVGSR